MSREELKDYILVNLTKLQSPNYHPIAVDNIKKSIERNINNENNLILILALINDKLKKEDKQNKKDYIKLLSLFTDCSDDINTYSTSFLAKVLTVIQSQINNENFSLFPVISHVYSQILESLFLKDDNILKNSETNQNISSIYELFQGFCIYNLKQEDKNCNIIGGICLNNLIQTCPLVLKSNYLNYIWKNIISNIEKANFPGIDEIFNSLITLIFACENGFSPYAEKTLKSILDFLSSQENNKRKLALNIVYTLINFCMKDIVIYKDQITKFLKVLKNDKFKDVREIAIHSLRIIDENKEVYTTYERGDKQDRQQENFKDQRKDNFENNSNIKNKNRQVTPIKNRIEDRQTNKENQLKGEENLFNDLKEDKKIKKEKEGIYNKKMINVKGEINEIKEQTKTVYEHINKLPSRLSSNENKINLQKVKEKEENNKKKFINNKMIIKTDPEYSIFKTKANVSFFKNNKFDEEKKIEIKYKYTEKEKEKDNDNSNNKEVYDDNQNIDNRNYDGNIKNIDDELDENDIEINILQKRKYDHDLNDIISEMKEEFNNRDEEKSIKNCEYKEKSVGFHKYEYSTQNNKMNEINNNIHYQTHDSNGYLTDEINSSHIRRIFEITEKQKELFDRINNIEMSYIENMNRFFSKIDELNKVIFKVKT